jgi:hypothetical protein
VQQWLEWALSFDLVRDGGDPIFDDTGDFQTQNQTYPVYMVGGAVSDNVDRKFKAPAGRPFLIPMLNSFCVGDPDRPLGGCTGPEYYDGDRSGQLIICFSVWMARPLSTPEAKAKWQPLEIVSLWTRGFSRSRLQRITSSTVLWRLRAASGLRA